MKELENALDLRKSGLYKKSNEVLQKLVESYPEDATINYHTAVSFDLLGDERKAVPYYEKAIQLGLNNEDLQGAFIGLGSTYRTLGEYVKAKEVLKKGMEEFPENRALQTFYAMTMYNLKEYQKAMEILLKCLIETTTDPNLLQYKRAIEFYSTQLDQIWE